MKKFIIIVSVIFCGCLFGYGQTPTETPFPENWQTFSPEKEEFSIEIPIAFEKEKFDDTGRRYSGKLNDTYFFIFSEKPGEADLSAEALAFIRGFQNKGESVAFGELNAEKFGFKDDEGFYQRVLYLKTKTRVYLFHTISANEADESAKRFLQNLEINGQPRNAPAVTDPEPAAPATGPMSTVAEAPSKPVAADPVTGRGTGGGAGSGSGSGDGTGTRPGSGPASVNGTLASAPVVKLRILAKPRAAYTDIARLYGVQGNVTLRVTFLAGGVIGSVNPIAKLPMGLTKTAITAARSMTFEPARRNGVPIPMTATIQYGFSIY